MADPRLINLPDASGSGWIEVFTNTDISGSLNGSAILSGEYNWSGQPINTLMEFMLTTGTFVSAPTADSLINLHLVPSMSGSYEDWIAGISASNYVPATTHRGAFLMRAQTTGAQIKTCVTSAVFGGVFKVGLVNNTGQPMPAAGNTLKMRSGTVRGSTAA